MSSLDRALTVLSKHMPHMNLSEALVIGRDFAALLDRTVQGVPELDVHAGRVAFLRDNAQVIQHLQNGHKIQAIKAAREALHNAGAAAYAGLKEAKDAVDEIAPSVKTDPPF